MNYTAIPSVKGQLTLPIAIRKKYGISQDTPLKIEDKGKGRIVIKVMQMIDQDDIEYFENEKGMRLIFKKGIDPQILINKIDELNGSNQ